MIKINKNLLSYIFSKNRISQHPFYGTCNHSLITVNNFSECTFIAVQACFNQCIFFSQIVRLFDHTTAYRQFIFSEYSRLLIFININTILPITLGYAGTLHAKSLRSKHLQIPIVDFVFHLPILPRNSCLLYTSDAADEEDSVDL